MKQFNSTAMLAVQRLERCYSGGEISCGRRQSGWPVALTRLNCYRSWAVASLICYPSDGPTGAEYVEADQHGNTQRTN